MTGFSADWLSLREGADHRSRNTALAAQVEAHFAGRTEVRVMDFGCGTGSNLRATAALLPAEQSWTLVDYDPRLLKAARIALTQWAESARDEGESLHLIKSGKAIAVHFREVDLNADVEGVLAEKPDLVTASALFDLISSEWMARFAKALRASGAAFYTVLTYDGRDGFTPPHALDDAIITAFAQHQQQDKGFGIAAGPGAADALVAALKAEGFGVATGDSPWKLGAADHALVGELLPGITNAVGETGILPASALSEWLNYRQNVKTSAGAEVMTGHTDIFAVRG